MFVSVSTWSQYSKDTFSPDAAHISDLHLNILAPVIFLKFPMKMKQFGLTEIKLFHFHRIFKIGGGGGGGMFLANPLISSGSATAYRYIHVHVR